MPRDQRFLVCDDNQDTADDLRDAIERAFPDATVDLVTTPKKIVARLDEVSRSLFETYWFLLVDIHLEENGPHGQVVYVSDLPFIDKLMRDSNQRVVFFMSANLNHPKIREFQERCNRESRARPKFFAKDLKGHWIEDMLGWMRTIVYSSEVQEQIKETFGDIPLELYAPSAVACAHAPAGRTAPGLGDATQVLAALVRKITRCWTYLDPETQGIVRRYFKVVEEGKEVRISMF
jgi:hypothetical protein